MNITGAIPDGGVSGAPASGSHDEDRHLLTLDAMDDPIPLADGADAPEPGKLADERLAPLLRRLRELINP